MSGLSEHEVPNQLPRHPSSMTNHKEPISTTTEKSPVVLRPTRLEALACGRKILQRKRIPEDKRNELAETTKDLKNRLEH